MQGAHQLLPVTHLLLVSMQRVMKGNRLCTQSAEQAQQRAPVINAPVAARGRNIGSCASVK